tara:strand:- start:470 stop:1195 length:726 start_codon:yes stop_codon:yes gene_type:complete
MKVFITGGTGLLGSNLITEIKKRNIDYFAPKSSECNIISVWQVINKIMEYEPDIVIHCAAIAKYKMVEEKPINSLTTNIVGTCNVIQACHALKGKKDIKFVYISSDHVFDGTTGNYKTTDNINPLSKYAKTKAAGELATQIYENSLIIRTSFCDREFPFNTAYTDKWTSQDYIDLVAPKILDECLGSKVGISHIGHERRSFYELAKERNKNVNKGSVSEIVKTSKAPILIDTSLNIGDKNG